ncbi:MULTISPECIES: chlorophyll a/b-binding protein [Leptolyngbya]|uniref:chlorophyll a/b-binding protein n=1 Tax=Leptolyngbya TaxID=47251 RepID=UPI003220258B
MLVNIFTANAFRVLTMQDTQKITAPAVEDRNAWKFGFTPQAELWNGRLAMIGFVAALITEYLTGSGVLRFLGLM